MQLVEVVGELRDDLRHSVETHKKLREVRTCSTNATIACNIHLGHSFVDQLVLCPPIRQYALGSGGPQFVLALRASSGPSILLL